MGLNTTATDWEFAGITQVSLSFGLGGGGYYFWFRSNQANIRNESVYFIGGGLGVGAGAGSGASSPSYSPISCVDNFSLNDLHNSSGVLVSAGAAALVGYSAIFINAINTSKVLFDGAGGFGLTGGGMAAGVNVFYGIWQVQRLWRSASQEEREMMRQVEGTSRRR